MRSLFWAVVCLVVFCLVGCGGSGSGISGNVKDITITPNPIRLKPSEKIQLTAVPNGGSAPITWAVNTTNGGTITQGGVYTAPAASGTYEIQVALTSDSTKFAKTNVIVDSGYVMSVTSAAGTKDFAPYSGTATLTAKVQGAADNSVTWTATSGTIDANGTYHAGTTTEDVTVTATSKADTGKMATIVIHVVPPVQIKTTVAGNVVIPSSYIQFSALITGITGTPTWTASSGTVAADGKWTADSTFVGNVVVHATATVQGQSVTVDYPVTVVGNLNVRFTFQNQGDVVLALRPDKAPKTSANLISLANAKFYDGIIVHRYEAGFVVQWGDPLTKTLPLTDPSIGTGGPGYTIDFEANDLLHKKYSLGMARSSGLNTGGSQIYLCLDDQPSLDGSYVVFGTVASGNSIVDALRKGDTITSARVELP